jgi:hypothetical protein
MSQRETIINNLFALCEATGYATTLRPLADLQESVYPMLVIIPGEDTTAAVAGGVWGHTLSASVAAIAPTVAAADTALGEVLTALAADEDLSGALHGSARVTGIAEAQDAARVLRHGRQINLTLYYETARWAF